MCSESGCLGGRCQWRGSTEDNGVTLMCSDLDAVSFDLDWTLHHRHRRSREDYIYLFRSENSTRQYQQIPWLGR